jgi:hypothetical protein
MENKIEIKFKNQKQSFEISEEEIRVELNTVKHKLKYNIPLDDIKNSWHIENGIVDLKTMRLFASVSFNIFLIICCIALLNNAPTNALYILFLLSLLPFVLIVNTNKKVYEEKHIGSSKLFYFIYTKTNASEVDAFIKLVYKKQNEFYKKKFFLIDPVLPYNLQYERYIWLYNSKIINENEFEVIKEDLDKYFNFNINNIQQ